MSEVVFSLLKLFLGNVSGSLNWDIEAIFVSLHEVESHEVGNDGRVLPCPGSETTGSVNIPCAHEVVHEGVEVLVRHAAHLSPESAHFQFSLVVHVSDKLLSVLKLHLELSTFLAEEIRPLLLKTNKYG